MGHHDLTAGSACAHALLQMHAAFLPTWQRILTTFDGYVAAGIVYDGNTGKVLPPWRGGTGALPNSQAPCRLFQAAEPLSCGCHVTMTARPTSAGFLGFPNPCNHI